ncbi:DUF6807 family protein, partial [Nonomuraea sp. NPDC003201]
ENTGSSHRAQLAALLTAMSAGERPPASGADGRRVMELITAMYQSAITGRPVTRAELDETNPFYHSLNGGGTVLAVAGHSSASVPIKWFVRTEAFAVISPSPSFDEEIALADGDTLELTHRYVFIDRVCERAELDDLGAEFAL